MGVLTIYTLSYSHLGDPGLRIQVEADMQDEFEMNMRLIGAPTMADVVPSMVDTTALQSAHGPSTVFEENCKYRSGIRLLSLHDVFLVVELYPPSLIPISGSALISYDVHR